MEALSSRLIAVATRVQTPLAVAGLVMVVLYAILSKILDLKIFNNIGESGTLTLLNSIVSKIFILAVVSLLLAVGAYLVGLYLKHRERRLSSDLELVDARLDPHSSDYVAKDVNGSQKIMLAGEKVDHSSSTPR